MIPTPSPGFKGGPHERIPDGPISEIDQIIEYYHCAKFGSFNKNRTIISPYFWTITITETLRMGVLIRMGALIGIGVLSDKNIFEGRGALIRKGALIGTRALNRIITVKKILKTLSIFSN